MGGERESARERAPNQGAPGCGMWSSHFVLGTGVGIWLSLKPLSPSQSCEKGRRGLLRGGTRLCFPTPGVVAAEECERALRNLVDTRNLSGGIERRILVAQGRGLLGPSGLLDPFHNRRETRAETLISNLKCKSSQLQHTNTSYLPLRPRRRAPHPQPLSWAIS